MTHIIQTKNGIYDVHSIDGAYEYLCQNGELGASLQYVSMLYAEAKKAERAIKNIKTVWLAVGMDSTGIDIVAVYTTKAGARKAAKAADGMYVYGVTITEYEVKEGEE